MQSSTVLPPPQAGTTPVTPPSRFADTEHAFAYKTDAELRKAHLLLSTIQNNLLVKVGPLFVNWALRMHLPVQGLIKEYFFSQFCGGTSLDETARRMEQLMQFGVASTLDYAVEGQKTERGFNNCADELVRIIQFAKGKPAAAFIALKMTGLGNIDLMTKQQAGKELGGYELMQLDKIRERLLHVCQAAYDNGQAILIDAEETWIQDYIDGLAEEMMWRFNQQTPVVFTTVQMYRHNRLQYLHGLLARAKQHNAIAGIKLVRGAYLEKETARAAEMGYANPMQPNKAATDRDYDAAVVFMLDNLQHFAPYLGTHNEASCLLAMQEMERRGLPRKHPNIWFSQLFGMSDNISFNMAFDGYNVAKYLPYGPVEAVMPYLFRRAQENTSIAGQTSRELLLIRTELERRKHARKGK
jgi:proline dehydrogenase